MTPDSNTTVIPFGDGLALVTVGPPDLRAIRLPRVDGEAVGRLATDDRSVLLIDQGGRRIRAWAIEPDGTLGASRSVPRLPAGAAIDDVVATDDRLVVAGHGPGGEMAWHCGWPDVSGGWSPMPIPVGLGFPGKSIDFLFLSGERLIGVDDIVLPKWNLVWRLPRGGAPELIAQVPIPSHTTYEEVCAAALGTRHLALLSAGINHGHASAHLSFLDVQDLSPLCSFSSFEPRATRPFFRHWKDRLMEVQSIAFCGPDLVAADGGGDLLVFCPAHEDERAGTVRVWAVPGLARATAVRAVAQGLLVSGLDRAGAPALRWLPDD